MQPRLPGTRRLFAAIPPAIALVLAAPAAAGAREKPNEYATAAELKLMVGFPPPPDRHVTKWNALFPPYNRWSYQHMRMFFPSVEVPSAKQPSTLTRALDPGFAAIKVTVPDPSGKPGGGKPGEYIPTKSTVDLDTYLKETYTDALVVIKGDKVVYEALLNGMTENRPHMMMSVTKSFTGLFGKLAVAAGKLDEDDEVAKFVPELKAAGAFKGAKFRHVLDMTNSMSFSEKYADENSDIRRYAVVAGLLPPQPGKGYEGSVYEYLPKLRNNPNHGHGAEFHYHTPTADVANWVTNRATGVSFQGQMQQLWSGIGAAGPTHVLLDNAATPLAGSGLNATPHDLAHFAVMMLNDGKFDGKQVVPRKIIEELSAGASREAFSKASSASGILAGKGEWSYRAMWWVRHTPGKEAFMACGIHGQWVYLDVKRKVAIVKQSSQPTSATDYQTAYDLLGFDAIVAHLSKP